jgi:Transposase DDE domain group 1
MPACYLCGPLITDMVSLADWHSASVILAKRNGFVIPRCRCFGNASTRSSRATRTSTTRIGYVMIQLFRFWPINRWVNRSDHNRPLSRWENSPAPRELLKLQDALLDWFVRICGEQVRKRGEILLDVDSTDDPTYGQQQLSFFNGGYDQHMYHPLLIFERHTGCLLAARLRPGRVVSHARIIPLLVRIVPRLQSEFPTVRIKLRADAGFATQLLYEFCEFFGLQYAIGIGRNSRLQAGRSGWSVVSPDVIVEPASRSAPFPAFAIVLTPGLISGASATRPNMPWPVATCVSWSLTCQAAAVPFFPSITIAGNVRTALRSSKMALPLTA